MNKILGVAQNIRKSLKERWRAETPKIYKKVRNYAVVLTFTIPMIGGLGEKYTWMEVPKFFTQYSWYLMTGSALVAGASQLTKTKDSDGDTIVSIKKDEEKKNI
jgi:hypothetical protein